jgi:hypothetical protein
MYKPIVSLVFLSFGLAGCAANQTVPVANLTADNSHAFQASAGAGVGAGVAASAGASASAESLAVAPVNVSVRYVEMSQPTVCEQVRRPGSRIILEHRCYTPDADPENDSYRQQMVYEQVEMIRREQEEMQRIMREREEAMRRAAMEQMMRDSMRNR